MHSEINMPKTRADTTVIKIIITIARFSTRGVGTLSGLRSGPNLESPGIVTVGPGGTMVGGFVIGKFSAVVGGGCVVVLDEVVAGVLTGVVVVVVDVVDLVVVDVDVEGVEVSTKINPSSVVDDEISVGVWVGMVSIGMVGGWLEVSSSSSSGNSPDPLPSKSCS